MQVRRVFVETKSVKSWRVSSTLEYRIIRVCGIMGEGRLEISANIFKLGVGIIGEREGGMDKHNKRYLGNHDIFGATSVKEHKKGIFL